MPSNLFPSVYTDISVSRASDSTDSGVPALSALTLILSAGWSNHQNSTRLWYRLSDGRCSDIDVSLTFSMRTNSCILRSIGIKLAKTNDDVRDIVLNPFAALIAKGR